MTDFPRLKTGAVVQYPTGRRLSFSNQVIRFVKGDEQRYRDSESPLRRWIIRLDLLDASELKSLEEFFQSQQGRQGSFTFTDPMDDREYPDCSLETDEFELNQEGEMRGQVALIVRENRGQ
jgi:hypothetical protein